MSDVPCIQYLNTDLYLIAPVSLEPLATEFEQHGMWGWVTKGEDGQWYANYSASNEPEPETNVVQLLDAIDRLSESSRALWEVCTTREFDIGYNCGDEPWAFNQQITNETIRRIAACGGTLRITIYPYRADGDPRVHHADAPDPS